MEKGKHLHFPEVLISVDGIYKCLYSASHGLPRFHYINLQVTGKSLILHHTSVQWKLTGGIRRSSATHIMHICIKNI